MEKIKELTVSNLKEIGLDFQRKIENGLKEDGTEILGLLTYIDPQLDDVDKKILALDWGGTNFRASIVAFEKGAEAKVIEVKKKLLSANETKGFMAENLYDEIASLISQLENLDSSVTEIGYCFSYPAESLAEGEARLLRWTKGINIPDMIGKEVGKPLMEYLNCFEEIKNKNIRFKHIRVINDTIACLFAGRQANPGYDSYIGLIVGTGTNMATSIQKERIGKLAIENAPALIPVNLESGNLRPNPGKDYGLIEGRYLTQIDKIVHENSLTEDEQNNPNELPRQLFEKAISGKYIGDQFSYTFPGKIEPRFDGEKLTNLMNYPAIYKEEYINEAREIYKRSAQLVAASVAGLILTIVDYKGADSFDASIKKVSLSADGSLFWSNDKGGKDYNQLVAEGIEELLTSFGIVGIEVNINKLEDANLLGSAIATF